MSDEHVRRMVEDPELGNRLYLVKNNVPFDVAMSLNGREVLAYAIIFGKIDGGTWCWETHAWKEPS